MLNLLVSYYKPVDGVYVAHWTEYSCCSLLVPLNCKKKVHTRYIFGFGVQKKHEVLIISVFKEPTEPTLNSPPKYYPNSAAPIAIQSIVFHDQ